MHSLPFLSAAARKPLAGSRSSCRIRRIPTTTGTSALRPSATRPMPASRILTADNRIIRIVNNYSRISFNFGPTLLSWLEEHAPDTYQAILDADKESQQRFSGHGNAIAQVYNHMIMPLANRARQTNAGSLGHSRFRTPLRTQARRHVAGRKPRSTWRPWRSSPSTASSSPCWRPRKRCTNGGSEPRSWKNVEGGKIDPDATLHLQSAVGAQHQPLLLRRAHLARGRL